jgi:hypothetical protein
MKRIALIDMNKDNISALVMAIAAGSLISRRYIIEVQN